MGSAFDDEDYILDLENASEDTEVEVVGIDDVEYTIIGKLQGFYYLINMEDPDDFLIMKEDGEIEFTVKGQKIAEVIVDKYVTLSGFLQDVAGVDEETAKEDAHRIQHYISDDTYAGIKQFIIHHPEL